MFLDMQAAKKHPKRHIKAHSTAYNNSREIHTLGSRNFRRDNCQIGFGRNLRPSIWQ